LRRHLVGLDHAVIRVADLDRAAADFARLGFTLTPRGRHSLGTENHCMMFGFDYLELLWVPPGVAPPFYADFPVAGEGMTGLALKSTDASSVLAAWERADLHPDPLVAFSRPVDPLPGGGTNASADPSSARFNVVPLPAERTPGGRAFACEHLTPGPGLAAGLPPPSQPCDRAEQGHHRNRRPGGGGHSLGPRFRCRRASDSRRRLDHDRRGADRDPRAGVHCQAAPTGRAPRLSRTCAVRPSCT
jgi:hypothetical protein